MFSNQAPSSAAAVGFLVVLLFLVGGAFAIAYPIVSVVSFVLAGLFVLVGGISPVSQFRYLAVWGFVALGLIVLSYFSMREKRKKEATEQRRVW